MDLDAIIERAAILEFCAGLSRFDAETKAAEQFGLKRWEVQNEVSRANSIGSRNNNSPLAWGSITHDLPAMQPHAKEEKRSVPERDEKTGRDRLDMLALRS